MKIKITHEPKRDLWAQGFRRMAAKPWPHLTDAQKVAHLFPPNKVLDNPNPCATVKATTANQTEGRTMDESKQVFVVIEKRAGKKEPHIHATKAGADARAMAFVKESLVFVKDPAAKETILAHMAQENADGAIGAYREYLSTAGVGSYGVKIKVQPLEG